MFLGWYRFIFFFLLTTLGIVLTHANHNHHHHHRHSVHHGNNKQVSNETIPSNSSTTIVVDQSGKGQFSTIQSAIDSVPSDNKNWVYISVMAGTYREKVQIPSNKPNIILKGEGQKSTFVEWDDHDSSAQSPTFLSMANNTVVKSISFTNTYNNNRDATSMKPAVSAMILGDKSYFYDVGFFGLQDTLWDEAGRHYFKSCTIQGAMDFIFGAGQSLYEDCTISAIDSNLGPAIVGFITAQGRSNPNDPNGFVFNNCNIVGNGSTFLGRPWRSYARVLFYNTKMANIIQPKGWQPWNCAGHEDLITFAEYGNSGPGADTTQRVTWVKKLDSSTVSKLASTSFIDNEGWVKILIGK